MRRIDLIVIHCSATAPNENVGASDIRQWHMDPKREGGPMRDIGYHYVIRRNGEVEPGRPEATEGGHARGYNRHSIGICLVGGIRREGKRKIAEANFTPLQWDKLKWLVLELRRRYPTAKIVGHRDLGANKECPSFSVRDWLTRNDILADGIAWDSGVVPDHEKRPLILTKTGAGAGTTVAASLVGLGAELTDTAQTAQAVASPFPRLYLIVCVIALLGGLLAAYGRWHLKARSGH